MRIFFGGGGGGLEIFGGGVEKFSEGGLRNFWGVERFSRVVVKFSGGGGGGSRLRRIFFGGGGGVEKFEGWLRFFPEGFGIFREG